MPLRTHPLAKLNCYIICRDNKLATTYVAVPSTAVLTSENNESFVKISEFTALVEALHLIVESIESVDYHELVSVLVNANDIIIEKELVNAL